MATRVTLPIANRVYQPGQPHLERPLLTLRCLCAGHYCFPGVPEMWLYYVYKAIQSAPWAWEGYTR